MENNSFGQFDAFGKAAANSAKELELINTKVLGKLTQKNMDLFNSAVELNNKYIALFGDVKGIQELITEQLQLTSEFNGKVISTITESAEIVVESKDDYQAWVESGLKSAAPVATKTTRKKAA